MKTMMMWLSVLMLGSILNAGEALGWINKELDLRVKLNRKYKIDYAEGAKGMGVSKELVPLELAKGQEWVNFLLYVRKHEDVKMKVFVLKLELQQELANYLYDLEYSETPEETASARKEADVYRKKLAELKKLEASLTKGEE